MAIDSIGVGHYVMATCIRIVGYGDSMKITVAGATAINYAVKRGEEGFRFYDFQNDVGRTVQLYVKWYARKWNHFYLLSVYIF